MVPGTFGVIGISANTSSPTGLVCLFNPGSLATGCLVSLTDTATGVTYCRVVGRSLDTPVNISLCPFSTSNGPLGTGVYSVVVYVIENDGSVSSVPAITGVVLGVIGLSTISPGISSMYVCVCVHVFHKGGIKGYIDFTFHLKSVMLHKNAIRALPAKIMLMMGFGIFDFLQYPLQSGFYPNLTFHHVIVLVQIVLDMPPVVCCQFWGRSQHCY